MRKSLSFAFRISHKFNVLSVLILSRHLVQYRIKIYQFALLLKINTVLFFVLAEKFLIHAVKFYLNLCKFGFHEILHFSLAKLTTFDNNKHFKSKPN